MNVWLKSRDLELAERVMRQMPKDRGLTWAVKESGDPDFPWALVNEPTRYGQGCMAAEVAPSATAQAGSNTEEQSYPSAPHVLGQRTSGSERGDHGN